MNPLRFRLLVLAAIGCSLLLCFKARVRANSLDSPDADLFVFSVNGRDQWSGHQPAPNADLSDGPFQTLERPVKKFARTRQAEPKRDRPITVLIRAGTHRLDKTLVLSPEDSGTQRSPVIYAAYPHESPILSRHRRIDDSDPNRQRPLGSPLCPRSRTTPGDSPSFSSTAQRFRPRWPKNSYSFISGNVNPPKSRNAGGSTASSSHPETSWPTA